MHTPPASDSENSHDESQQRQDGRALRRRRELRKSRERAKTEIKKLKIEVERQKQNANRWKQKHFRLLKSTQQSPSPNKKAELTIKKGVNEVKKKLILGEIIMSGLKSPATSARTSETFTAASTPKTGPHTPRSTLNLEADVLASRLFKNSKHVLKKYHLKKEVKSIIGWRRSHKIFKRKASPKDTKSNSLFFKIKMKIVEFLEDDENSFFAPGKRDTITKNKIKKQKRYLRDSLLNLHKKYIHLTQRKISYALFCRCRPFWIMQQKLSNRDTCMCKKHANFKFIFDKCRQYKLIAAKSTTQFIESLCCEADKMACMYRKCIVCIGKLPQLQNTENRPYPPQIFYYQWVTECEERSTKQGNIKVKITKKVKVNCTIEELIAKLISEIQNFFNTFIE